MMAKSVIEGGQSRSNKRPHGQDEEKEASPPKVNTPQTRSQAKSVTPSISARASRRSPRIKAETPITKPKGSENTSQSLQVPKSSTRKRKSDADDGPDVRMTRRRSQSGTPGSAKASASVTRSNRNNTPLSAKQRDVNKVAPSSVQRANTRALVQHTPTRLEPKKMENESSARRAKGRNQNSPTCDQTPKIPHSAQHSKGRILDRLAAEKVKDKSSSVDTKEKQIRSKSRGSQKVDCDVQNNEHSSPSCVLGHEEDRVSSVNCSPDCDAQKASSRVKNVNQSSTDTSGYECTDEIRKEVEKVKKRRSTIGQRKSRQSFCDRKSLGSVLPILSLEDQISSIEKGLPQTSKVGHLIDICLREAMRRLEDHCNTEENFPDMRIDLITSSESIGGHTAYKIAGMPLDVCEGPSSKGKGSTSSDLDRAAHIKARTKKLEEEYKCWKSLVKERKVACQSVEREFREAKSGETKIDEEITKTLTDLQKNILRSKPNYNQYMEEIKVAYEKTFFVMQEVKQTANVVSNFTKALKVVGDSCYSAVEEMCFGPTKSQPLKSTLNSLLTLGDVSTI
ncbi:muscle M-line assembly protein unc-89-like [Palaemon carinicauda]|uniref:muscle M-line assembly protein unc-89-like n=1 Tax=Palaemon carinicauda TaxID=392227 RepID=UPI0035B59A4A